MFMTMDERYMRNRKQIEGALDAVKAMEAVVFDSADNGGPGTAAGVSCGSIGGCAHVAVQRDFTGIGAVDLEQLVPVLVKAVQELEAEVQALKAAKKVTTRRTTKTEEA